MVCECQGKYTAIISILVVRYIRLDEEKPHVSIIPTVVQELLTQKIYLNTNCEHLDIVSCFEL